MKRAKKMEFLFEQIQEFSKLADTIKSVEEKLKNTKLIQDNKEFMERYEHMDHIVYLILEDMTKKGTLPEGMKKEGASVDRNDKG